MNALKKASKKEIAEFAEVIKPHTIKDLLNGGDVSDEELWEWVHKPSYLAQLFAVSKAGWMIDEVTEQTEAIRLAAVKNYAQVLRCIKKQTEEMCLIAVTHPTVGYFMLEHVHEQTPVICLAAVKANGQALQYVREQTPEICWAALEQDRTAAKHIRDLSMLAHQPV